MTNTQPQQRIDDLVLVDVSEDARDAARDRADARLTEELGEGGKVRRFAKSIWKGNVAKEYYRQKYIRHAHAEIEQSQDVLMHEEGSDNVRQNAMVATIDRFQSEYDEAIHGDAGEQREALSEDSEIGGAVKDLIRQYAGGQLNDESLNEEFTRTIAAYRESGGADLKGSGIVQMSNMIEIARQVRSAVDHGESLDAVMREFNIVSGEARTGVRSAAKYDKVEKIIDKVKSSRVGQLIPSTAIVAGVSIAASVARLGSTKAVYAAASTISLGVGAGLLSGLRERKRVKDERIQHSREMAQGKEFDEGSRRRGEMDATRYESVDANQMSEELSRLIDGDLLDTGGQGAVEAALEALARAETFVKLSDQRDIDLISYSDVANVAQERFELDIARAEAKVALRQRLDVDMRQALGLDVSGDIDGIIDVRSAAFIESIDEDISAKDQAFNKLRRRRTRNAALAGAATGLAFGLIAQETLAGFSGTRSGLVERLWSAENAPHSDGMQHNTVLNGLVGGDSLQDSNTIHHDPSSTYAKYDIGDQGKIRLPDDYKLIDNKDGTISIVDPNGETTISSLSVHDDGSLPKDSRQMLRSHGMVLDNISRTVEKTNYVDVNDYIGSQHDTTTHVTRELWYDNDTPKPVFDQNELGMSWGGDDNTGITPKGDYTFNVSGMQADGSYHEGESTDWANQAEKGNLKLAVSASKDTQAHVFMLDINQNGGVIIPKDGPAGALFENQDGHAVFKGAYAETVQITGEQGDATTMRPLATVVGENNPNKIPVTTEIKHPGYKITPAGYETIVKTDVPEFTEVAPVTPIVPRRPLEKLKRRHDSNNYYGARPAYGSYEYRESERRLAVDRSPRLNDDPSTRLDTQEELSWYRDHIRQSASDSYADEIDTAINSSPELSDLSPETETIVTIPVAAASESENIYKTLSLYAQQGEAVKKSMILLHVNWFDSAQADPEKSAKIQKTIAEIERAQRDFPDLKIASFQTTWNTEKQQNGEYGNGMIGHVAQRLYDTAMMAVEKGMREGQLPNKEILLLRNDADAQGMDRQYLERMLRLFNRHPTKDIFNGAVRWETSEHKRLPGLAFATNFREIMHVLSNRKGFNSWVPTIGINMGARMSTLAAVGGIGHDRADTGAGTDDLAVGGRIETGRAPFTARRSHSGSTYNSYGGSVGIKGGVSPEVTQYVPGANIDSKVDRLEAEYIAGNPITAAWGGFDQNGYKERDAGLSSNKLDERGMRKNKAMISRVEASMSAMITEWFHDPSQVATGLSYLMPTESNGRPTYRISQQGGVTKFRFTDTGKKWAKKHLSRDPNRVSRELYRKVSSLNRTREPRFV